MAEGCIEKTLATGMTGCSSSILQRSSIENFSCCVANSSSDNSMQIDLVCSSNAARNCTRTMSRFQASRKPPPWQAQALQLDLPRQYSTMHVINGIDIVAE